jgi:lysophospholipase L1-like esterase
MRWRIEQTLCEGQPDVAVLFGGANDAIRGIDATETERNITFMVEWLSERGVSKIALIDPGMVNWKRQPEWAPAARKVRNVLRGVAARHGAVFVDLTAFMRERIDSGKDPDFTSVPYQRSCSWHVSDNDAHFNAYGQRLVAEAFLAGTASWRPPNHRATGP